MDIAVYRLPSTATTVTDVTRNPIARNRLNNGNAAYCFFFFFFFIRQGCVYRVIVSTKETRDTLLPSVRTKSLLKSTISVNISKLPFKRLTVAKSLFYRVCKTFPITVVDTTGLDYRDYRGYDNDRYRAKSDVICSRYVSNFVRFCGK